MYLPAMRPMITAGRKAISTPMMKRRSSAFDSAPMATRDSLKKYSATIARMAPSWIRIAKLFQKPSSPRPKKRSANNRWPVDDTGRNSVTPSIIPRSTARSVSDIIDPIHDCRQNAALLAYSAAARNCKKRASPARSNEPARGRAYESARTASPVRGQRHEFSRMPARRPTPYTFADHALMVRFATANLRRSCGRSSRCGRWLIVR